MIQPKSAGLVYTALLTLAFVQTLTRLMLYAGQHDLHSYIVLVPSITGFLLYTRRGSLPAPGSRSIFGTALLGGLGLVALAAALAWREGLSVNDHLALMALAFVSFVAAGGFLFLGARWMASAAFPAAFLIFLVPLPDAAVHWLENASALASAEAGPCTSPSPAHRSCGRARYSSYPGPCCRWHRSAAGSAPVGCCSSPASSPPISF